MTEYTATTTNATNTITATPSAPSATVEMEVNGSPHPNGTAITWQSGANTIVIIVENGSESEAYTVTVTKS